MLPTHQQPVKYKMIQNILLLYLLFMNAKKQHGGVRKGQGRKKLPKDIKMDESIRIMLTTKMKEEFKEIKNIQKAITKRIKEG